MWRAPACGVCGRSLLADISAAQCGDVFHTECIRLQLVFNQTCPMCRRRVEEDKLVLLRVTLGQEKPDSSAAEWDILQQRTKVHKLESDSKRMKAELLQAEWELAEKEVTTKELTHEFDRLTNLLTVANESIATSEESLRSITAQHQAQKRQISDLQPFAEKVRTILQLPTIERAFEIRDTCRVSEQVDLFYTQQLALRFMLEDEGATKAQNTASIAGLERTLRAKRRACRCLEGHGSAY